MKFKQVFNEMAIGPDEISSPKRLKPKDYIPVKKDFDLIEKDIDKLMKSGKVKPNALGDIVIKPNETFKMSCWKKSDTLKRIREYMENNENDYTLREENLLQEAIETIEMELQERYKNVGWRQFEIDKYGNITLET